MSVRKVEVVFRAVGGTGKGSTKNGDKGKEAKATQNKQKAEDGLNKGFGLSAAKVFAVRAIYDVYNTAMDYANFNLMVADDYRGQRLLAHAKTAVSIGSRLVGSTAVGWAIGGLPGAVAGFAISVAEQGIDMAKNLRDQDFQLSVTNKELDFSRVRAGYAITSGSIGEDK